MERWRHIVLGAVSERRRAQELGILGDPFPPEEALLRRRNLLGKGWMNWVKWTDGTDFSMDDRLSRRLARSLQNSGVGAWAFNVSSIRACLLFGAGELRGELRPFEAESVYADWGVSDYYAFEDDGFMLARERAAHLAGLLAGATALPRDTGEEEEVALLVQELAAAWEGFVRAKGAVDLMKVRLSRIIHATYYAALWVKSDLHDVDEAVLRSRPRAWALYWAAMRVSDAIERSEMLRRPPTREDARLCLDMRLWLKALEREAKADLVEVDLLKRIDVRWPIVGSPLSTSVLAFETPHDVPEHVLKKWNAKAKERVASCGARL